MILELDRENHLPLYAQIAGRVRDMIVSGALKIGDRLPANRELAKVLAVNRNTVTTAYAELLADGLITSHVGRGTFVCAVPSPLPATASKRPPRPSSIQWSVLVDEQKMDSWLTGRLDSSFFKKDAISLAYSLPPSDLFPIDDFRRAVDQVVRKEGRALIDSGAVGGYAPLQEYIAAQMSLSGPLIGPDHILVTNGCQQSLNLIRDVLAGPGDEVAIETPTYPGALSIFCGHGSKHVPVPVGAEGMDLEVLEDILSQRRPKLIYTIPNFNNPTGATMPLAARRALLELAVKYKVPVIEDDIYGELRYEGASVPTLKALDDYGVVIYINSFSKVGFPGIRVGWIAADTALIRHLSAAKRKSDLHTSLLSQAAVYEFSRHGLLARHIKRSKKAYIERRDAMLAALEIYFPDESSGTTWTKPEGGMAIWVTLPEPLNANQILLESVEKGVVFSPGGNFYPNLAPGPRMRLCYSTARPDQIEESIKRLGSILKGRLTSLKRQHLTRNREALRALV
ncbi:MAG TPA: PLP-dependent aminotransferase family protein [Blastocatellia bacterium]|nr:PLP-dependent aminotransferase family protein [Blastocatellia bacterium]